MRHATRYAAVSGIGLALSLSLVLGLGRVGSGQAIDPTPPPVPPELNQLANRLAEQSQALSEEISEDLAPQAPNGRTLLADAQELHQATEDFRNALRARADVYQARQHFAGIDNAWQRLKAELAGLAGRAPDVDRVARRFDGIDNEVRQSLGVNAPPPNFFGNAPTGPRGIAETQRLAGSLAQRAQDFTGAIRYTMGNDPNAPNLLREADRLALAADQYHDALNPNQPLAAAVQTFAPVDEALDRVERLVTTVPVPAAVQTSWQAVASVEVLLHENLGLAAAAQPAVPITIRPPAGGGPSPILGLAAQLDTQTDEFVDTFSPIAGNVPEGNLILADAQRLQAATDHFRKEVAGGLDPGQLAYRFRDVDICWQRVARRVNRIAQGRTGPRIALVQQIGQTCEQIHRALGMPGYPPTLNGPLFRTTRVLP